MRTDIPLITDLEEIKKLAERRSAANWRFRTYVKGRLSWSDKELDAKVRETSQQVATRIDCTRCAECCKVLRPTVDQDDAQRLARRLGISDRKFEEQYLLRDEFGERIINQSPCPFLKDNRCSVYEDRPKACRDYPYLESEGFRFRMMNAIDNCARCPIVFNTLEDLKRSTGFLSHQRKKR